MSENNDMTCAELADVAAELALGVLTGRERAIAVAHLDACEACREDVRQLMATGDQLLELLPPAEPPAGFETRVLARLGLPAPPEPARPRRSVLPGHKSQRIRYAAPGGTPRRGAAPSGDGSPAGQSGSGRPGSADDDSAGGGRAGAGRFRRRGGSRPGQAGRLGQASRPGQPGRPGQASRPGRMRRALAATAIAVAVIAAGVGGWRIGVGTAPQSTQLTSANLLTAADRHVGDIFFYSGDPRWLFMSVDLGAGHDEPVTCQLVGANGQVSTLGSFRLADGYGSWGSPDPGTVTDVRGARLVSATGTILATATFARW